MKTKNKKMNLKRVIWLLFTIGFCLTIKNAWADCLCQGKCYCIGRKGIVYIKIADSWDTCDESDFCRSVCRYNGYIYNREDVDCTSMGCPLEALYGADSEETELLRSFRDNVLSKTTEGQELISLYYSLSPVARKVLAEDEALKEEVKEVVDDLLYLMQETE